METKIIDSVITTEELDNIMEKIQNANKACIQVINMAKVIMSVYGYNKEDFTSFDGKDENGKYTYFLTTKGIDIILTTYVINNEKTDSLTVIEDGREVCNTVTNTVEDKYKKDSWLSKLTKLYQSSCEIIKSMNTQSQLLEDGVKFLGKNSWYIDQVLQYAPECTTYFKNHQISSNVKSFEAFALDDKLVITLSTETKYFKTNKMYPTDVQTMQIYDLTWKGKLVFKANNTTLISAGIRPIEVYVPGDWEKYIYEYFEKNNILDELSKQNAKVKKSK